MSGLTWQAIGAQKKLGLSEVAFPGVTPEPSLGEEQKGTPSEDKDRGAVAEWVGQDGPAG